MKPCKNFEEKISEMLLGEISENEADMLHIHMANCEGCMEFYLSLFETLKVTEDKSEFHLTEGQKNRIFDLAKQSSLPPKKFPNYWNIGASVAASLAVSGFIILSDMKSNSVLAVKSSEYKYREADYAVKEDRDEDKTESVAPVNSSPEPPLSHAKRYEREKEVYKGKSSKKSESKNEAVVVSKFSEEKYNNIEIPTTVAAEDSVSEKLEDSKSNQTGKLANNKGNSDSDNQDGVGGYLFKQDKVADDINDKVPSTDDNLSSSNFSDVVVSPSAVATPISESKEDDKRRREYVEKMKEEESLDLTITGDSHEVPGANKPAEVISLSVMPVDKLLELSNGKDENQKEKEDIKYNFSDSNENSAKPQLEGEVFKKQLEKAPEESVIAGEKKIKGIKEELLESENAKRPMLLAQTEPMSTFSIDVDTASYQMAKQVISSGQRPNPLSIRAEEFINSFNYNYEAPKSEAFKVHSEVVESPFHRGSSIMKIGVQGKRPGGDHRAPSHFCFIVDTSGSMAAANRLPMVKKVLPMIIKQMSAGDKVSLISCGLKSRLELDYVDIKELSFISERIDSLNAVGATNLEASLLDGYEQTLKNLKNGIYSRVILFSDGVANLGEQNAEKILQKLTSAKEKGVGITVVGMGSEEYNDNFLETLANKGDGNYVFIGDNKEAQKTFEEKFASTFHTIAYNVKIQVEFDPSQVAKYRLLGYENRRLANKDFRNDKVDAGEVGSGQSVTAIYEIELTGKPSVKPIAEVRLRYKDAVDMQMKEFATPILQNNYNLPFEKSSSSTRLAFIGGKFAEVMIDGGNSEGITMDGLLKYLRPLAAEANSPEVNELLKLIEKSR